MISKKFIKSSFIYTIAGTLPMASAFLLLPLYIDNLTTTLFGELTIYNAFASLVQVLVAYSFDTSLYIHFHEFKEDKHKLSVFVSSAFVFMLIISLAVGLFLVAVGDFAFDLAFPNNGISFYPFGLSAIGIGVFQSVFKVYSNLMQSREKPEVFFWANLLTFSAIAGFTYLGLVLYPGTLVGPMVGKMLACFLSGGWVLFMVFREFGFHFDFKWLKSSFSFNNYTFIYQLEQWLINNFDRVIMAMLGLELAFVGVYDFVIKCLVMIELVMNGLHSSFYPKMVSIVVNQDKKGSTPEINRYYHGLIAIVMLFVGVSIFGLPIAIDIFASKKGYQDALKYIPFVAVLYFLKAIRLYFALPYGTLKYSKPLPIIYGIVTVVKIGLIVLIANKFEVYGVIVSSFVAAITEILLLRFYVREKFSFKFNAVKIVIAPMVMLLLIVITEALIAPQFQLLAHAIYLLFCFGLLYWTYRNEIKTINFSKLLKFSK